MIRRRWRILFHTCSALLMVFYYGHENDFVSSDLYDHELTDAEHTESGTINIHKFEFFARESLLTATLELFRNECDCTLFYQWSEKCEGNPSSQCEAVCCSGLKAKTQSHFVRSYRHMIVPKLPRILVGVASSGKTCDPRVLSIAQTWGRSNVIPPNVRIRFFYGGDAVDVVSSYFRHHGIPQDLAIFLPGISDDQYPPVRKNMSMLNWLRTHLLHEGKWDWIFKVDDDTFVNWPRVVGLLSNFSPHHQRLYLGQRGYGRPTDFGQLGLMKPFCMGGPGYVMSVSLLRDMPANAFPDCAENNSLHSDKRWHSDVIAGLCVYEHTRLGCWDRNADATVDAINHESKHFFQDFSQNNSFPEPVLAAKMYTLHPFKEPGSMVSVFARISQANQRRELDEK